MSILRFDTKLFYATMVGASVTTYWCYNELFSTDHMGE